ncbi:MAG: hypothetical protein M3122_02635 [Actinomycetota bacterium]|nr:hypothetical protein [Actinomycetota bacterium]
MRTFRADEVRKESATLKRDRDPERERLRDGFEHIGKLSPWVGDYQCYAA